MNQTSPMRAEVVLEPIVASNSILRQGIFKPRARDAFMESIYDTGKHQFKNSFVPAGFVMIFLLVFFLLGWIGGAPTMLYISLFALGLSIISVFHDNWILNSMVVPFSILFTIIAMSDAYNFWFPNFIYHIIVSACSVYVAVSRPNTSVVAMIITSVFYAAWATTIHVFLPIPAYSQIFGIVFTDSILVFVLATIACLVPSILATVKNTLLKVRGAAIRCDGGMCPI